MAGGPSIAVVIPSWNCVADLRDCLDSVQAQTDVEAEVMVVDNGSEDDTVGFLDRGGFPHIALSQNVGFSPAVNLGISRTRSPLVMVLNADTVLEPDCLSRLVAGLEGDSALGGIQPLILQLDRGAARHRDDPKAVIFSLGQGLTRDGRGIRQCAGLRQGAVVKEREEVFGVCGTASLLRRRLLMDLGGYDERYFAFYEDVDLNVRARIAGWRFCIDPGAVAWHVGAGAWSSGFERPEADNARLVARNRLATQIKFVPARWILRIAVVEVGSLARATAAGRLRQTLAGKIAALRWLPDLLRERRRLRRMGELERARVWLGRQRGGDLAAGP